VLLLSGSTSLRFLFYLDYVYDKITLYCFSLSLNLSTFLFLEWRNLYNNKEIYGVYSSQNSIRVIKSRRMRWAGHVEGNGRKDVHRGLWCVNLMERDHVGDLGLDGRIKLRLVHKIWDGVD
jgi:hypothetical protein